MIAELIAAGILVGEYIYHRWLEPPAVPPADATLGVPIVNEGAAIPLIYGRCRVRSPVLAWTSTPIFEPAGTDYTVGGINYIPDSPDLYFADLFFVLGIPFYKGKQTLFTLYVGDTPMSRGSIYPGAGSDAALSDLNGNGGAFLSGNHTAEDLKYDPGIDPNPAGYAPLIWKGATSAGSQGLFIFGAVEFLNGNPNQKLVDIASPYTPRTEAGYLMTTYNEPGTPQDVFHYNGGLDPSLIPGYRHNVCAFLYSVPSSTPVPNTVLHWCIGSTPDVQAYHFEVASQANTTPGEQNIVAELLGTQSQVGDDANPALVIYDLLTSPIGKLGLDPTLIAPQTFINAGHTLFAEGHGFSYAFDQEMTAQDMIAMVLRQIDAMLYFDPEFGQLGIRLVRADYEPNALLSLSPSNCEKLDSTALSGWSDIPNKIRVTFSNRLDLYRPGSSTAQNQANAASQDGETREVTIDLPGVCTQALADSLAQRELSARSRPLLKLKATGDRTFWRTLPGDVIRVTWPEYGINGACCRVISADRGTLEDGRVVLELLQDYFYIHGSSAPVSGGIRAFPAGSI